MLNTETSRKLGHKTSISEKPRWAQFHRLTGLKTGKSFIIGW